jgi:hypothetical protein
MSLKLDTYRGVAYPVTYKHVDAAGAALALTGKTLYFTVKSVLDDTDEPDTSALIQKTITSHVDENGVASDVAGTSFFWLTDADMYQPVGKYYFDFIVENADGKSLPPSAFGRFNILGHPTNRNVLNG